MTGLPPKLNTTALSTYVHQQFLRLPKHTFSNYAVSAQYVQIVQSLANEASLNDREQNQLRTAAWLTMLLRVIPDGRAWMGPGSLVDLDRF